MVTQRDWTGDASVLNCNIRSSKDDPHDYYATDPHAVELLLDLEEFSDKIWEPACGEGHMAKVLSEHGYEVVATDLIDRGYGKGGVDFFQQVPPAGTDGYNCDIVTNPPYKFAKEFCEKSLELVATGHKIAMFLPLTFLESKGRRDLFLYNPPQTVYVACDRLECGKNGVFTGKGLAKAYCWIVWRKGYPGPTNLRWFN